MDELLNKQFLQDIGVSLDESTYQSLSKHYEETLNERIIEAIIDELDENQLNQLHNFLRNSDYETFKSWLVTTIPQLRQIVEDEVVILLGEIAESGDRI